MLLPHGYVNFHSVDVSITSRRYELLHRHRGTATPISLDTINIYVFVNLFILARNVQFHRPNDSLILYKKNTHVFAVCAFTFRKRQHPSPLVVNYCPLCQSSEEQLAVFSFLFLLSLFILCQYIYSIYACTKSITRKSLAVCSNFLD